MPPNVTPSPPAGIVIESPESQSETADCGVVASTLLPTEAETVDDTFRTAATIAYRSLTEPCVSDNVDPDVHVVTINCCRYPPAEVLLIVGAAGAEIVDEPFDEKKTNSKSPDTKLADDRPPLLSDKFVVVDEPVNPCRSETPTSVGAGGGTPPPAPLAKIANRDRSRHRDGS